MAQSRPTTCRAKAKWAKTRRKKPAPWRSCRNAPAPGKNIFMMAHGGIFWEATGFSIQEAHAVVLDPANLKVIMARIGPQEWGTVAQARPK